MILLPCRVTINDHEKPLCMHTFEKVVCRDAHSKLNSLGKQVAICPGPTPWQPMHIAVTENLTSEFHWGASMFHFVVESSITDIWLPGLFESMYWSTYLNPKVSQWVTGVVHDTKAAVRVRSQWILPTYTLLTILLILPPGPSNYNMYS